MARITRVTQPIFAASASNNGVFGSAQDGTKVLSSNLATLMGKPAWAQGWLNAVIGASKFPPLEEFQALTYIQTTQLAYLLQDGIPEWDAGTTYYQFSIVKRPGTYQLYGSNTNANLNNAVTDQTNWTFLCDLSAFRLRLTGNANYYVATTGNDSNNGSIGSPWLTIQHAVSVIQNAVDLSGFTININVADGTYTGGVQIIGPFTGSGVVNLIGNTTTPANCVISTTAANCIDCSQGTLLNVQGFKLTAATSGDCVRASRLATINVYGNMEYSAVNNANSQHIYAFDGGIIYANANYKITGTAASHYKAAQNSLVESQSNTVTITGTPAFAFAFAFSSNLGDIATSGQTYSGSATGQRYQVQANSIINTNAGGATYLPGNSAGSSTSGGQYI